MKEKSEKKEYSSEEYFYELLKEEMKNDPDLREKMGKKQKTNKKKTNLAVDIFK